MEKKKPLKQHQKKVIIPQTPIVKKPRRDFTVIFLCVIIAIVSYIRYRLIAIPFERDEGEYGYVGNLILHGIVPYKDAYSMKLPGTSFMYAVLMSIFGRTNSGVHLGMVFINAGTMYFLFAAFKRLFTPFVALCTASIFGFMAIGLPFEGFSAHATQFICFYSSIALLFITNFMKSGKMLHVFLFGLLLGMALLMKQQALFLILFGAVFLFIYLKTEKKKTITDIAKQLLIFGAGVIIPFAIVVLIIVAAGQFSIFWLWTIDYASKYEAIGKTTAAITRLFTSTFFPAWDNFYYLWLLALAGILVLFWSSYTRLSKIFALLYCIASVCVFSAGFYFRQHYYIVLLPSIGLLTGICIEFIASKMKEQVNVLKPVNIGLLIFSILICFNMYDNSQYYFHYTPASFSYADNPFNQAKEISKYISNNSSDTDRIAVLGSEPEICFYANRKSATGFLYTYPLVEIQPYNLMMQEQMIWEIEKSKPLFFLFCNISYSWLIQKGAPNKIFQWGQKYTQDHYSIVGIADYYPNSGWSVYWNDAIKSRTGPGQSFIYIYKRNVESKL